MPRTTLLLALCLASTLVFGSNAEQCGKQAGGALCPGGLCCSKYGYCGNTAAYCDLAQGCQSGCPASMSSIVTQALFNNLLLHRNDAACPARNFYTFNAFITAARSFPAFGNTGDLDGDAPAQQKQLRERQRPPDIFTNALVTTFFHPTDLATRKKEIAAFFGQTSHETTGGWPTAPDGPYTWGYCYKVETGSPGAYCTPSAQWPCAPGKKYYGREPIQLTHNYNYGPAGKAIGAALLANPDLVASDAVIAFKTALWFWMTPQSPKPSAHNVITGAWTPSAADIAAGRQSGYGVITKIINGGLECGRGPDSHVADRIGFYNRYCAILGVSPGANLDCYRQKPFG